MSRLCFYGICQGIYNLGGRQNRFTCIYRNLNLRLFRKEYYPYFHFFRRIFCNNRAKHSLFIRSNSSIGLCNNGCTAKGELCRVVTPSCISLNTIYIGGEHIIKQLGYIKKRFEMD